VRESASCVQEKQRLVALRATIAHALGRSQRRAAAPPEGRASPRNPRPRRRGSTPPAGICLRCITDHRRPPLKESCTSMRAQRVSSAASQCCVVLPQRQTRRKRETRTRARARRAAPPALRGRARPTAALGHPTAAEVPEAAPARRPLCQRSRRNIATSPRNEAQPQQSCRGAALRLAAAARRRADGVAGQPRAVPLRVALPSRPHHALQRKLLPASTPTAQVPFCLTSTTSPPPTSLYQDAGHDSGGRARRGDLRGDAGPVAPPGRD
jgi:hypothetical protein